MRQQTTRSASSGPRGQSELVGIVLLFGMVIAAAGIVFVAGTSVTDSMEDQAEVTSAEQSMTQVNHEIRRMSSERGNASSSLPVSDREVSEVIVEEGAKMTFRSYDDDGEIGSRTIDIGSITYVYKDGTRISSEAGGVWRMDNGEADDVTLVSPPPIDYDQETRQLSMQVVTAKKDVDSNTAEIEAFKDAEASRDLTEQVYDDLFDGGDTVPEQTEVVIEDSQYQEAWYSFLERNYGHMDGVTVTNGGSTVTITFGVGAEEVIEVDEDIDDEGAITRVGVAGQPDRHVFSYTLEDSDLGGGDWDDNDELDEITVQYGGEPDLSNLDDKYVRVQLQRVDENGTAVPIPVEDLDANNNTNQVTIDLNWTDDDLYPAPEEDQRLIFAYGAGEEGDVTNPPDESNDGVTVEISGDATAPASYTAALDLEEPRTEEPITVDDGEIELGTGAATLDHLGTAFEENVERDAPELEPIRETEEGLVLNATGAEVEHVGTAFERETNETIVEERDPVDVVFVLDRSGSMDLPFYWHLQDNIPEDPYYAPIVENPITVGDAQGEYLQEYTYSGVRPAYQTDINGNQIPRSADYIVTKDGRLPMVREGGDWVKLTDADSLQYGQDFWIANEPVGDADPWYGANYPRQRVVFNADPGAELKFRDAGFDPEEIRKDATENLIEELDDTNPDDRVAVTQFSTPELSETTLELQPTADAVDENIDVAAGGGTFMDEGFQRTIAELEEPDPDRDRHVIVLTDGEVDDPTEASTGADCLAGNGCDFNATVHGVGLGNADAAFMQQEITSEDGIYSDADSAEELTEAFEEIFDGIISEEQFRAIDHHPISTTVRIDGDQYGPHPSGQFRRGPESVESDRMEPLYNPTQSLQSQRFPDGTFDDVVDDPVNESVFFSLTVSDHGCDEDADQFEEVDLIEEGPDGEEYGHRLCEPETTTIGSSDAQEWAPGHPDYYVLSDGDSIDGLTDDPAWWQDELADQIDDDDIEDGELTLNDTERLIVVTPEAEDRPDSDEVGLADTYVAFKLTVDAAELEDDRFIDNHPLSVTADLEGTETGDQLEREIDWDDGLSSPTTEASEIDLYTDSDGNFGNETVELSVELGHHGHGAIDSTGVATTVGPDGDEWEHRMIAPQQTDPVESWEPGDSEYHVLTANDSIADLPGPSVAWWQDQLTDELDGDAVAGGSLDLDDGQALIVVTPDDGDVDWAHDDDAEHEQSAAYVALLVEGDGVLTVDIDPDLGFDDTDPGEIVAVEINQVELEL